MTFSISFIANFGAFIKTAFWDFKLKLFITIPLFPKSEKTDDIAEETSAESAYSNLNTLIR